MKTTISGIIRTAILLCAAAWLFSPHLSIRDVIGVFYLFVAAFI
jgi:hypothetical protein